ncbi:MAG: nucleotidyltransferase family protein [Betaproteobacteria bacterium]
MTEPARRGRGRPRSASPLTAAERMRRYRARLRERGWRRVESRGRDPLLAGVRFSEASLLTPGEREVLRRFCAQAAALPRAARKVLVFGSRARGDADERSDLDVAVRFAGARDRQIESALSGIALRARRGYSTARYGIRLKPVALFDAERGASALAHAVAAEGETIWTRPG